LGLAKKIAGYATVLVFILWDRPAGNRLGEY